MKKMSDGVLIYGIILLVFSVFSCLIGVGMSISSGPPLLLLRYLVFFTPICLLISSIGLLMLWNWTRYLFIISASVMSLMFFASFVFELWQYGISDLLKNPSVFLIFFGIVCFFISAIRYFTRSKVKEQFKKSWNFGKHSAKEECKKEQQDEEYIIV